MNTSTYKTLLCLVLFVLVILLCYLVGRYFSTMYENLDTLSTDIKIWIKGVLPNINDETMDLLINGGEMMDSSFNVQKTNGFSQRGIFTDTDLAKVMQSAVLTDEEFTTICKNADLNDVELATMIAAKTKLVETYAATIPAIVIPSKSSADVSGNAIAMACGNTITTASKNTATSTTNIDGTMAV